MAQKSLKHKTIINILEFSSMENNKSVQKATTSEVLFFYLNLPIFFKLILTYYF